MIADVCWGGRVRCLQECGPGMLPTLQEKWLSYTMHIQTALDSVGDVLSRGKGSLGEKVGEIREELKVREEERRLDSKWYMRV